MNRTSKTYQSIKPLAKLIQTGRILCIDPSTGSQSSMPGFAVYQAGILVEYGTIEVDHRLNRSLRLYEISRTIREDFSPPADILIVEYIPPMSYKGGGMNSIAIMALQKALGAIIGALPFGNLIEVPAAAWKTAKDDNYIKTDAIDAVYIGKYVLEVAEDILNGTAQDKPIKPKQFRSRSKVKKKKAVKTNNKRGRE